MKTTNLDEPLQALTRLRQELIQVDALQQTLD
jgi:hypothetical protein